MRIKEKTDAKKVIKDLAKSYGDSNENQGKMVQLMRGLAFSDDPAANKFMKDLDKWTTDYAKKVKESFEVKVGDKLIGKDQLEGKTGTVISIDSDMAQVDFGNGDVYGILLRRIKNGKIYENTKKSVNASVQEDTIELQKSIVLYQEDDKKIILEKGDRIKILEKSFPEIVKDMGVTLKSKEKKDKKEVYSVSDQAKLSKIWDDALKKFYSDSSNKGVDISWDQDNDGDVIIKKK